MFPRQEHVWIISCVFNTPCPTCAFAMHWSIPYFFIQHVMFTLCFIAFYLVLGLTFIFSFISHPSCIIIIVHTFISYPRFSLTLYLLLTKRGKVYSRKYTGVFCHFYTTLVHIFRGRNSISHAHLQGERYSVGEIHIPRGRRYCVKQKISFYLFSFWLMVL